MTCYQMGQSVLKTVFISLLAISYIFAQPEITNKSKRYKLSQLDYGPTAELCINVDDPNLNRLCTEIELYKILYREINKHDYDRSIKATALIILLINADGSMSNFSVHMTPSTKHKEAIEYALKQIPSDFINIPGSVNGQSVTTELILNPHFEDLEFDSIIDEVREKPYRNNNDFLRQIDTNFLVQFEMVEPNKLSKKLNQHMKSSYKDFFYITGDERVILLVEYNKNR